MSIPNNLSEIIPQAVLDSVAKKLQEANDELKPYLVETLSKEENDALAKLGEKSEPFVDKGIEFALTNPRFVPDWISIPEAEKDFKVFTALRTIEILAAQLLGGVSSTRIVGGAESLAAINIFYGAVGQAHKDGVAAATPIYEELRKRYIANGRRKKQTGENPA